MNRLGGWKVPPEQRRKSSVELSKCQRANGPFGARCNPVCKGKIIKNKQTKTEWAENLKGPESVRSNDLSLLTGHTNITSKPILYSLGPRRSTSRALSSLSLSRITWNSGFFLKKWMFLIFESNLGNDCAAPPHKIRTDRFPDLLHFHIRQRLLLAILMFPDEFNSVAITSSRYFKICFLFLSRSLKFIQMMVLPFCDTYTGFLCFRIWIRHWNRLSEYSEWFSSFRTKLLMSNN